MLEHATGKLSRRQARLEATSFAAKPTWTQAACRRVTVQYLAFDGDIEQRTADLDPAITGLGCAPAGRVHTTHRYLVAVGIDQPYATGCPGATCNGTRPSF